MKHRVSDRKKEILMRALEASEIGSLFFSRKIPMLYRPINSWHDIYDWCIYRLSEEPLLVSDIDIPFLEQLANS